MGKSAAVNLPFHPLMRNGNFQSVKGNLSDSKIPVPPQGNVPLLTLFHMHGCPYCQGLPGNDGVMANAANNLIKYKEVERQHPVMDELSKLFDNDVQVQGFPTIAIVTPSLFLVYKAGDRSMEAIREWIKGVLSWIDQASNDTN